MEKSLHNRFINSQDQLIISLNQQIEAMIPLKDSYTSLQRYHLKLLHDFESLISQHDQASSEYTIKIQELFGINQELDIKKNQYIEELRNLQNQKAKITLERKNMMSCCQTLSSKFNLQNQQTVLLQERSRQIVESIKKTQQNIALLRRMINQIQTQIKLKGAQSVQIQNQIARRDQFNRKCTQKIQSTDLQIKSLGNQNQKSLIEIKSLQKTQDQLENKIHEELRRIKSMNQKILQRRQQLANLNHQRQYYSRLIQSELLIKQDLDLSENKLSSLITKKQKEIQKLSQQNLDLQQKIRLQQQNNQKSQKYKKALGAHLGQLVRVNTILLQTMKRTCRQDQRVHQILHSKLDHLDCAVIRSAKLQNQQVVKKTFALRQKSNDLFNTKKAQKSGSTWINQLSDIQNL